MEPVSGGGPLAAHVTAAAAELLAAIARASKESWPDAAGVAAQADSLRDRVAPLAEMTAQAYEHALAAEGGDYELGRAYARAAEPPLRIAEAATAVSELAAPVAGYALPALPAHALSPGPIPAGGGGGAGRPRAGGSPPW